MQEMTQWQDETLVVDEEIVLRSVHERYEASLYALVVANRAYLQQAMNWPQYVTGPEETRKTLHGNYLLHHRGYAKMFLIFHDETLCGVVSFNQVEPLNKTAYNGYWLEEGAQGRGIISRSIQAIMRHYADKGEVRRFVIKCIVTNEASNRVAQRNGFSLEGCLKQAEYLNGDYHDQNIYGRIIEAAQNTP
ncbi:50S ribosomal protein L7/L12-serine acetyltransferase [Siccibacter turicensis]|uniref:50S ribosomal protein L7/L12-serine acetyltransferase n=1 Tax=Siccibacter turicensis TaxID=357233 RepID=A0A2P8VLE3_9ENTR|nr:50S ribosomal protein L7/L12-serine acetyltransferase [Siccibacter turicensis]PSN08375.1 50S ribosomal protein L7/L12-serine acetyltransferase [Siccibacter turicensis]